MFEELPEDEKNGKFLDDFRQRISNGGEENFEEKKYELNKSKNILIGTVSGIVLAGIVGFAVLSPKYATNEDVEVPVVRHPQAAVKVQPMEPGGMEILN